MRLVVDANVVISALARDGAVRATLRTSTDDVFTPWYIHVEIDEHRSEIRQKSGLSSESFDALLDELWDHIDVIPQEAMMYLRHHAQSGAYRIDLLHALKNVESAHRISAGCGRDTAKRFRWEVVPSVRSTSA